MRLRTLAAVLRNVAVGIFAPIVAVLLAVPANADTDAQDQQFIGELKAAGWAIPNPSSVINQAHLVCGEGFSHGVSWQEMRSTLVSSYGFSQLDASTLIRKAVSVYCPKYAGAVSGIGNDIGNRFTEDIAHWNSLGGQIPGQPSNWLSAAQTVCDGISELEAGGVPAQRAMEAQVDSAVTGGWLRRDGFYFVLSAINSFCPELRPHG